MTYQELLTSEQWLKKRQEILQRDGFECQKCKNSNVLFNSITTTLLPPITNYLSKCKYSNQYWAQFYDDKGGSYSGFVPKELFNYLLIQQVYFHPLDDNEKISIVGIRKAHIENSESKSHIKKNINQYYKNLLNNEQNFENKLNILKKWEEEKKNGSPTIVLDDWLFVRSLQVHHNYYILGIKPWEYEENALITFCQPCHKEYHKSNLIPIYDIRGNILDYGNPCERCSGIGYLPEYFYFKEGICFNCMGNRFTNVKL